MALVAQINTSPGGVPKLPVDSAEVTSLGLAGDQHEDRKHHGGPDRAVCLYALELIQRLREEGHPIAPGTTGENLTLQGVDWQTVIPGARFVFDGGVELEAVSYTVPCSTIRASFQGAAIKRISQKDHPGWSRVYARVLTTGVLRKGEPVRLIPAQK